MTLRIFITEMTDEKGDRWAGPVIAATSLEQAKILCKDRYPQYKIIGEQIEEIDYTSKLN